MAKWLDTRSTALALLLLAIFFFHALSVIPQKSIGIDEPALIAVGLTFLKTGDITMGQDTPPLVKVWSALPLLFLNLKIPWEGEGWREKVHWKFGNEFFAANPPPAYHRMIFWARAQMIFIACALGWMVFFWARRLYGARAALAALVLFTTEPNMLGNSILVKTDMAAALVYILFFYWLSAYVRQPSLRRAALLGVIIALGLLSKLAMIILVPLCASALLARSALSYSKKFLAAYPQVIPLSLADAFKHLLTIAALVLVLLHAGYALEFFRSPSLPVAPDARRWGVLRYLLPPTFMVGNDVVFMVTRQGWPGFLCGQFSERGWWYYYPVSFAIKLPVVTLILFVAALGIGLRNALGALRGERSLDYLMLTAAVALYGVPALVSHVNAGLRHTFPLFAPLFILSASVFASALAHPLRMVHWLPLVLLAAQLISVSPVYPDYLSYFNELIGGPRNGWRYLSDSNIDWGQDLPQLAKFMRRNGIERIHLAYFGAGTPEFYGIRYDPIAVPNVFEGMGAPPLSIAPGWYAISVNWLQGTFGGERKDFFQVFREQPPIAQVGFSIHVYRVQ
jgi:hypothetical protein